MKKIKNDVCCVVIPTYKEYNCLGDFEKISLKNTILKLNSYEIILIHPKTLNVEDYKLLGIDEFICFDDMFFKSLKTYNDLMLSKSFYEKFKKYEYILLVQLDAYVFKDNLSEFTCLGYDYIGCLHYTPYTNKRLINGNGGFSLRKVDSFINASMNIINDLKRWDWEDILYSYWYKDNINVAPEEISLKFGWQQEPEYCYVKNNNQLPFGCHGLVKYGGNFKYYLEVLKNVGL